MRLRRGDWASRTSCSSLRCRIRVPDGQIVANRPAPRFTLRLHAPKGILSTSDSIETVALPRTLGTWHVLALVIGITIGSGIFRTPAVIAARVPDPLWMLGVWLAGGLISMCGALSVAELAAALPRTGGWYAYLRAAWGPAVGFLFGWTELVLIRASATGAIALVCSTYLARALGLEADPVSSRLLAAGLIVGAALINIRGVRFGATVTAISTLVKVGALVLLVLAAAAAWGHGVARDVAHAAGGPPVKPALLGLGLISVLWAYDGFADVAFAAGEVRHPQRTLPSAIVGGTFIVLALYLAVNVAYLSVMPTERLAQSSLVAADVATALFGAWGGRFIAIIVAVSTFGSLIGISLAAPRVFFAMAEDRLFFPVMSRIHPRYETPFVAIALSATLGVFFVLTRTFEQLADTFVIAIWPFYGVAVAGVYRLRQLRPDLDRPYRTPGYPLVPAIFIAGVVFLVSTAIIQDPLWTGVTLAIALAGLPLFLLVRS
jgi:APA family basic amino acid/polyamine antiporter